MTNKPVSKETLGLVKAALAEPTPEEAARKLALVKRLESDVDFRHAIEKRNQVAEEAQNELPGLGAARAEALLRRVDATAGEGAEAHDTMRDVAGAPASKETRDALEKGRTQPGLQPALTPAAAADATAGDNEGAPAADMAPPASPESRSTSRWLIWLGLLALVAVGVVIWIVVGRLMPSENAGVPSAVGTGPTVGATSPSTQSTASTVSATTSPVQASSSDSVQPSGSAQTSATVSAKPHVPGTSTSTQTPWFP